MWGRKAHSVLTPARRGPVYVVMQIIHEYFIVRGWKSVYKKTHNTVEIISDQADRGKEIKMEGQD